MCFRVVSDKKYTENKTIRFPEDLIEEIEEAIVGKETSFSGFVLRACRYALDSIQDEKMSNEIADQC